MTATCKLQKEAINRHSHDFGIFIAPVEKRLNNQRESDRVAEM
jgi:hypothetical protein